MDDRELRRLVAKVKYLVIELEDVLDAAQHLQKSLTSLAEAHSAAEQPRMAPLEPLQALQAVVSTPTPDRGLATAFPEIGQKPPFERAHLDESPTSWLLQRGSIMLPAQLVHGHLVEMSGGLEQAGL